MLTPPEDKIRRQLQFERDFRQGSTSLNFYGVSVRVLMEIIETIAQPLTYLLNA